MYKLQWYLLSDLDPITPYNQPYLPFVSHLWNHNDNKVEDDIFVDKCVFQVYTINFKLKIVWTWIYNINMLITRKERNNRGNNWWKYRQSLHFDDNILIEKPFLLIVSIFEWWVSEHLEMDYICVKGASLKRGIYLYRGASL